MKNLWKSIGKAALYFLVYFLMQAAVSGVYSVMITTKLTVEMMGADGSIDMELLTAKVMDVVMPQAMTLTLISSILTLLILGLVFLIRKKNFLEETSIRSMPVSGIVPVALAAVGFNIVVSKLLQIIPFPESWIESYQQNSSMIGAGNMAVAWIATVIVAPILEEIVFRGLIYTRLKQGMAAVAAAVIASLLFALSHGTIVWGIYTFLLSMILIWTFERFQSLTANICFHFFFNLTGMVLSSIGEMSNVVEWVMFAVAVVAFVGGMVLIHKKTISE